jgi:serine/threonine protein kinase
VFLVEDSVTGSEVVLKVYNPARRMLNTPSEIYRWESFERESRILQRLVGQRDIIQLVSGQSEFIESIPTHIPGLSYDIPFAYYVLEKADGGDMLAAISRGTLGALDNLQAFRCMVRAVQRIHALGIAHRDIKPDNFLVTASGVKLSDFGTARFLDGTEPPILAGYERPVGDPRYTSPEAFALLHDVAPEIAFKGDVFALGASLFEMFTGVNLGVQLFGGNLLDDLTKYLVHVPRAQRTSIYRQLVDGIAKKYPLPSVHLINPAVPPPIRDRLNGLYKGLCSLDYLARNCNFPSIFRQIDTCILILRNETQYQRGQAERQKRRAARLARKANHP